MITLEELQRSTELRNQFPCSVPGFRYSASSFLVIIGEIPSRLFPRISSWPFWLPCCYKLLDSFDTNAHSPACPCSSIPPSTDLIHWKETMKETINQPPFTDTCQP
ncbi:hypothetical protein AMECASPLE_000007 [Ameca splendens]|uniref:Uncharacterized protein n=1 Tax=Ameca splendens TaxID=208324 RepID=A0ABV0XY09_9TELE